jgi:hypothetical protein
MFYRISLIINSFISALFTILVIISAITNKKIKTEEILGFVFFILIFLVFLWFNSVCFKVNRFNKDNILVSPALKRTGNVLFVFNLIAAVIIIICIVAMVAAALTVGNSDFRKSMLPIYVSFIMVFILSGATGIINGVFFKKSIKINNLLVNDFINDIGQQE